eukprot:752837-Hanusia_phi.AAC.2
MSSMQVDNLQPKPPLKRRESLKVSLSGECLENLEELAKRANCVYSKRSKRCGEPDVNSFLKGLGPYGHTSSNIPVPIKTFDQLWDEISAELHLPADYPRPKDLREIQNEEARKLFWCKFQTMYRCKCEQMLHDMMKSTGGSYKTHEDQWKLFGNLFDEGTGDKQSDKLHKFLIEKVFLGLAHNNRFKDTLTEKIRTDQHVQNKLGYIVRSFPPDVNESCTKTLKGNMPKHSHKTNN